MENSYQNKSENFSYLLKLLSSTLNETEPQKPKHDTDWALVFSLARRHSVAGQFYCAVKKLPAEEKPPEEILRELKEYYEYQVLTDINIDVETEDILRQMKEKKLYAMPLKGYILKHDYPISAMRTMADVDILYRESQQRQVKKLFIERGYTYTRRSDNEMDFVKGEVNHYEVQANLVSPDRNSHIYFSGIWDRVAYRDNFIGEMTLEDFYLYMLEHLAYHFEHGGVGLRMFMDIYVFTKAHGDSLDRNYVDNVLSEIKLSDFQKKAQELSLNWFGKNSEPDVSTPVADFIMNSDTFGKVEYSVVGETVRREQKSGKRSTAFGNLLRKLFPSYVMISNTYPVIRKIKVLYPFAIPVYWFERIFIIRKINTKGISNYLKTTESETAQTIKRVISDMGLQNR